MGRQTKRETARKAVVKPSVPDRKSERFHGPLLVLALAALTILAFSNSLGAGLALDSTTLVLKDPRIRATGFENLRQILEHSYYWPSQEAGLYRPLTTLSFWWNYSILENGVQPAGYHWLNVFLHMCNVVLAYLLARRLVGRADLLASFGVLSSLLLYLRARAAS